ncbi:MAG: hypothetical protein R3192_15085 [Woeseiaceae bacterium]|nr:hypothetical protein [Woeseiaceae bacterium]
MCRTRLAVAILAACLSVTAACVLRPAWLSLAIDGGLESAWLETSQFRHRILVNEVRGTNLNIFIEGDGGPWIRETRVSVDPTPANPVLLRLMLGVSQPAVYLGRPCYFGTASDRACDPTLWTFERYGEAVVSSMCEAANRLARDYSASSLRLIGYSGGAAIAIGMSICTERLESIITIAGNLDPDAWAFYHGYSPLTDITPLQQAMQSPSAFDETHWQCRDDEKIPPSITRGYFLQRPNAIQHIVDDCSHAEGWEQYWSRIFDDGAS